MASGTSQSFLWWGTFFDGTANDAMEEGQLWVIWIIQWIFFPVTPLYWPLIVETEPPVPGSSGI